LMTLISGDPNYANLLRPAMGQLMRLAQTWGIPAARSNILYRAAIAGDGRAFEALALPVITGLLYPVRSVTPVVRGRLSGLGAVLAVM